MRGKGRREGVWKSVLESGEGEGRCGGSESCGGMCGEVLREVWKSVLGCGGDVGKCLGR